MSYRGRGRGGFHNNNQLNRNNNGNNNFNPQNINNFVNANAIPVEITGWNGASMEDCIKFISRKCRIIVSNAVIDNATGVLKGYVKNNKEADDLCTWSGVKFAGQSLKITKSIQQNSFTNQMGGSSVGNGNSTIETISEFLKSRYQADIKLLNLTAVQQDPTLISKGFFASISTTSKFFPALMKVASELKLDVESIDLSGNNLNDLNTISALSQSFPLLKNLSLLNNNFSRLKVFESWRHKLNFLRELILVNNPLLNNITNINDVNNIKLELMKTFPRLIVLNGEVLRNEEMLGFNLTLKFDHPQQMFFQDDDIQGLSTNFVTNFFKIWDTNRQELMGLYQNESQFSILVDSAHPYLINTQHSTHNNFGSSGHTDFGYYIPHSRNLTKISAAKSRINKLAIGQEQIFKSFSQLPKTKHDLINKPNDFSMEAVRFPQLNGVLITIHGSFQELAQPDNLDGFNSGGAGPRGNNKFSNHKNKRVPLSDKSFDRIFLVIPNVNGGMVLASDSLIIRNNSGSEAWNENSSIIQSSNVSPAPVPAPAPAPTPTPAPAPAPAPMVAPGMPNAPQTVPNAPSVADLPDNVKSMFNTIQQELLVKILLETNLNLQYGVMLCEQSNWDYQLCILNFKNSEPSLPREAYAS